MQPSAGHVAAHFHLFPCPFLNLSLTISSTSLIAQGLVQQSAKALAEHLVTSLLSLYYWSDSVLPPPPSKGKHKESDQQTEIFMESHILKQLQSPE